jgi:hypothetical protein
MRTNVVALMLLSVLCSHAVAGLTGNIVNGGNFENPDAIKTNNLGVIGKRPWQFNNDYTLEQQAALGRVNDVGLWIGSYGAMTHYDDPRSLWPGTHIDYSNTGTGMGCTNVSVDPFDGANHVMETTGFRSIAFQIMAAPANQATGTASISFDYFWKVWAAPPAYTRFQVRVFGLQELPTFWDGYRFDGNEQLPGAAEVFRSPTWDNEWMDWVDPVHHITTPPDPPAWQNYTTTFELAQTYPYYYILYNGVTYHEAHEYFWLEGGRPTDSFALAWDDVSLQLRALVLYGDMNRDGNVNALDISLFISRLTTGTYQEECDVNQDGACNALDISPFVSCITGGACGGGQTGGGAVPEPTAAAAILAALVGGLFRRSR